MPSIEPDPPGLPGTTSTTVYAPEGVTPPHHTTGRDADRDTLRDRIRRCLAHTGIDRSDSWVHRVSRDYARIAIPGTPVDVFIATRLALSAPERRRLAERADLRYLLSYADPTGETAIRNLTRQHHPNRTTSTIPEAPHAAEEPVA